MSKSNKDLKTVLGVIAITAIVLSGIAFLPNLTFTLIIGVALLIGCLLPFKATVIDNFGKAGNPKNIIEWSNLNKFWILFFAYHLLFFISKGWDAESWIMCIGLSFATWVGSGFLVVGAQMFAPEKGTLRSYIDESKNIDKTPLFEELIFAFWKPIWILSIFIRHYSN